MFNIRGLAHNLIKTIKKIISSLCNWLSNSILLHLCRWVTNNAVSLIAIPITILAIIVSLYTDLFKDKSADTVTKNDSILLQFEAQEIKRSVLDSLYREYWQRLADKKYEMDDYKIYPDFDLGLSELLDECDTITKQLVNLYEETYDYDTIYQRILTQLNEEEFYVDERVLNIIQTNLEQWENRNIGIPNTKSFLRLYSAQLRVRTLELLRKQQLQDERIKLLLQKSQKDYEILYDNAYYLD